MPRGPFNLTRAFVTYLRPLLQYCTPVLSSYYKSDGENIENILKPSCEDFSSYANLHLPIMNVGLQCLELRCKYSNLTILYKVTK